MIRKLSFENTEVLRSQIEIPSIKDAVIELILNSIEANATSISINVHNFTVTVSDDGDGFDPKMLKRYSILYILYIDSSKIGQKGSILASLSVVSQLEILTRKYWTGYHAIYKVIHLIISRTKS